MARMVPLSEYGIPVGEYHHRARLSDATVRAMRDAHELLGMGAYRIARQFGTPLGTTKHVIYYTRRNVIARDYRQVPDGE